MTLHDIINIWHNQHVTSQTWLQLPVGYHGKWFSLVRWGISPQNTVIPRPLIPSRIGIPAWSCNWNKCYNVISIYTYLVGSLFTNASWKSNPYKVKRLAKSRIFLSHSAGESPLWEKENPASPIVFHINRGQSLTHHGTVPKCQPLTCFVYAAPTLEKGSRLASQQQIKHSNTSWHNSPHSQGKGLPPSSLGHWSRCPQILLGQCTQPVEQMSPQNMAN